jgi:single-stranded-DNA-specific exonuclease
MNSRWFVNRTNQEYVNYLSGALSISPLLAQILINRRIKTVEDIEYFLFGGVSALADPFVLPDMSLAVERIGKALRENERVFIHGDYDADGICAAAIVYQSLTRLGADCRYFIPNRFIHGYGFNSQGVEMAEKAGARLIITVDCGINSLEAAGIARDKGIDVIITDHHEPPMNKENEKVGKREDEGESAATSQLHDFSDSRFVLPDAVAVVNPKLMGRDNALAGLSGAAIAFKMVQALDIVYHSRSGSLDLIDLATLGTIADVVPVTGENRVILKQGLPRIERSTRAGIRALLRVSGIEGCSIKAGRLAFTVIPRINAAGRIEDATDVVKLLSTDSDETAYEIASRLDRLNSQRQEIEENILREAMGLVGEKESSSVIVLASDKWHLGVNGIVASRIVDQVYRPAIVLTVEDRVAKGSARSIPSFDICGALSECSDLLIGFGGHEQAAGLKIDISNLDAFEKRMCSLFDRAPNVETVPSLKIDADVSFSDIDFNFVRELGMLEPFGFGNPEPLFGSKMLEALSPRIVGNNHIKMKLRQKTNHIDAIGFGLGEYLGELVSYPAIDAVFTPTVNEWNGNKYLQLILKAFRPSK